MVFIQNGIGKGNDAWSRSGIPLIFQGNGELVKVAWKDGLSGWLSMQGKNVVSWLEPRDEWGWKSGCFYGRSRTGLWVSGHLNPADRTRIEQLFLCFGFVVLKPHLSPNDRSWEPGRATRLKMVPNPLHVGPCFRHWHC